jgi:hypothetical protein
MTFVLFIAVIALGWLVVDTRRRLDTVERQLAQRAEPDVIDALSWPEPKPETMVARRSSSMPAPNGAAPARAHHKASCRTPGGVRSVHAPRPSPSFGVNFEDVFGRKLPIWAGGLTLLIAAGLMVRYSIDAGLVSPLVRVTMGAIFGLALIGAGEVARRKPDWMPDTRLAQALAGPVSARSMPPPRRPAHSMDCSLQPTLLWGWPRSPQAPWGWPCAGAPSACSPWWADWPPLRSCMGKAPTRRCWLAISRWWSAPFASFTPPALGVVGHQRLDRRGRVERPDAGF